MPGSVLHVYPGVGTHPGPQAPGYDPPPKLHCSPPVLAHDILFNPRKLKSASAHGCPKNEKFISIPELKGIFSSTSLTPDSHFPSEHSFTVGSVWAIIFSQADAGAHDGQFLQSTGGGGSSVPPQVVLRTPFTSLIVQDCVSESGHIPCGPVLFPPVVTVTVNGKETLSKDGAPPQPGSKHALFGSSFVVDFHKFI